MISSASDDFIVTVTEDPATGDIYAGGSTYGALQTSAGGLDAFLVKYNSQGVRQFTRQYGSSGDDQIREVIFYNGEVYVSG